jgi:hypothetical protein
VSGRQKKKKLLIAESEAYRQMLRLQIQNLRIHGLKTKRDLTSFNTGNPLLMTAIPMLTSLFRGKSGFSWKGLGSFAVVGWQLYRLFNPARQGGVSSAKDGVETPAADEYLEKRT